MGVLSNAIRLGASQPAADESYKIEKSLRLSFAEQSHLNRTFTISNPQTWTFNCWYKSALDMPRHAVDRANAIFGTRVSSTNDTTFCIRIETDYTIKVGTENETIRRTTQLFRDPGAWQMLTFVMDTTNATDADRFRIYVNGVRVTDFSTSATITRNRDFGWNKAGEMNIGRMSSLGYYPAQLMADVHFIDGKSLDPSSFGSLDSLGVWNPTDLLDDTTYTTWAATSVNDGTIWSSGSMSGTGNTIHAVENCFHPGVGTKPGANGTSNGWMPGALAGETGTITQTLTLPTAVSVQNEMVIWMYGQNNSGNNADSEVTLGGHTLTDADFTLDATFHPVTVTGSRTITTIENKRVSITGSYNGWVIGAIFVDGHQLVDGVNANSGKNSFHLKFNDTSRNSALGKDTLNGKIEDATGGLPIYNTTDDYGDVKGAVDGAVYRADSSAGTTDGTGLVYALPGDVIDGDVHNSINTGSSKKTTTATGNVVVSTAESRLYGSSLYFDGTGDKISTGSDADFATGTGAFTYELWFWWDDQSANATVGCTRSGTDANGWSIDIITSDNKIQMWKDSANNATANGSIIPKRWTHFACVRDGSNTMKFYIDGVEKSSATVTNDFSTSSSGLTLGNVGGGNNFKGYYQDVRFYKGTAKYTANFKPPTRNDFTVNNLAATGGSKLYSEELTSTTGWHTWAGTYHGPDSLFDGSTATGASPDNGTGAEGTWTPAGGMAYSKSVEVWGGGDSGHDQAQLNSDGWVTAPSEWLTLASGSGTITTIKWRDNRTNAAAGLSAIRIDGVLLVDPQEGDVLTDSPTSYGTDTGQGGEVSGNYCTLNPLQKGAATTLTNGNLQYLGGASNQTLGTIGMSSGKWYWEDTKISGTYGATGIALADAPLTNHPGQGNSWAYNKAGTKWTGGASSSYGATWDSGDTIGVAFDADVGSLTFYLNGATQGVAYTGLTSGPYFPTGADNGVVGHFNFGQRPFKYDNAGTNRPSTQYKCLCSTNLAAPALNDPSKYFDIKTYTGAGGTTTISGLNFQPDMVWSKCRNEAVSHIIYDAVRTAGPDKGLNTDLDRAEGSSYDGSTGTRFGHVSAFTSDGYTVVDGNQTTGYVNKAADTYVSWNWDAGSSITPSSSYNITPSAQWVNATAGFSITGYTGNSSTEQTIPHGQSAAPDLIITRARSAAYEWPVYHSSLATNKNLFLHLDNQANIISGNADNVDQGGIISVNNNTWTATVGASNDNNTNADGVTYISYAWSAIPGYSAFGSYTGNQDNWGPFVYTGFKTKWLMIKRTDADQDWLLVDAARNPYNPIQGSLYPDEATSEYTGNDHRLLFLSNGFQLHTTHVLNNASGGTYVYCAFAESPFKLARAF